MKSLPTLALGLILIASAGPLNPTAIYPDEPKANKIAPIRRPPGFEQLKREAEARREAIESGRLAPLPEEGAAVKPTPRVPAVLSGFAGMSFNDTPGYVPPDTHAATGPDHIVETVNTTVAFFNRTTGAIVSQQDLSVFFSSVGASTNLTDPVVAYDDLENRFFIGVLDFGASGNQSHLLYAVSDTSDPTAGFTEKHSIDLAEPNISGCPGITTVAGDFTRVGWNANAHVFTFNMFNFAGTCFDHVTIITIDKSTVLDANLATPLVSYHADRNGFTHFTLAPATMHGSLASDPMWFVEEVTFGGGNQIRVVQMTNLLSGTPTFTDTDVTVVAYEFPPSATQKGSGTLIDAGDTRILNAEWRSDRLVASHTVGLAGAARARWYEFDTDTLSTLPELTQQGTINPGSGVHTYYPSIAIAANGDLGMTFMQSSGSQFMSMYVTGRLAADAPGTMQMPVLAKAGARNYRAFDCPSAGNTCRAGDFSGITADPNFTSVFCAANEYATSTSTNNWGTWIACFSIGVHDLAVVSITAPRTARASSPVTLPVTVVIQNRSDHNETVSDLTKLGDGTTTGLVRLSVDIVDDDGENCQAAGVALNGAKNTALFAKGPNVLKPGGRLTLNYLVTYNCSNAKVAAKTDLSPGDYSHTATVHHDVLDGKKDVHAADDICPHSALPGFIDPSPPPKGTIDKGCGAKKPDGTLGGLVVTDVVL